MRERNAMQSPNLTISNPRESSDILKSLVATHVFGVAAYYQLGNITHRGGARWGKQHILMPVIFMFFPLLYPCQVLLSMFLVSRNYVWRPNQGLNYYFCSIFGMFAERTSFVDQTGAVDEVGRRRGNHLLLDVFRPRSNPRRRNWSGMRVFNIIIGSVLLGQSASTLLLYAHRWSHFDSAILEIDHRIGLMAAGCFASAFGYLFFEITGFDWEDTLCTDRGPALRAWAEGSLHEQAPTNNARLTRNLADGIDTSNKYLSDSALAIGVHVWFLHATGRCVPFFDRTRHEINSLPISKVLPYGVLLMVGVPLMADVYWSSFSYAVYRKAPGAGAISRFWITLAALLASAMSLRSEAMEFSRILRGQTDDLNEMWTWNDSWSNFLWPL